MLSDPSPPCPAKSRVGAAATRYIRYVITYGNRSNGLLPYSSGHDLRAGRRGRTRPPARGRYRVLAVHGHWSRDHPKL